MAKTHHIRFLMRSQAKDLIFEVRQKDCERLEHLLLNAHGDVEDKGFFWFDSLDGRSIAINLRYVQGVRFIWDRAALPSDIKYYDGPTRIFLSGRTDAIEDDTENLEELYDFFTNLEYGPGTVPYPCLVDEDGEMIYFDANEVVMVSAPAHLVQKGGRLIAKEDGLDDDKQS